VPPFTRSRRIPPPPEMSPAAASRILVNAPAHQPDLVRASRKSGGGTAEGSTTLGGTEYRLMLLAYQLVVQYKHTS